MPSRSLLSLCVTLVTLGLAACATTPTAPTTAAATVQASEAAAIQALFPKLQQGMGAADIRAKLGEPAEISPMASPHGHAETWTYYFQMSEGTSAEAVGSVEIPTMTVNSGGVGMSTTSQQTFRSVHKRADVTLSLLMFNDHLAAQKAKVEHVSSYH
ncbi:MAG TPA: hypothetical protein VG936_00050 [Lacunisphaera sp.]|nr:hypothetical protein [Lacunisphaera sp.]